MSLQTRILDEQVQEVTLGQRKMIVKVHILGSPSTSASNMTQIVDPWERYYEAGNIIAPLYDPYTLAQVGEISSSLNQCISAMITNVDGFGWELARAEWLDLDEELPDEANVEKEQVRRLFNYCNRSQSFNKLRHDLRRDYELIGMAYMEIVNNRAGEIIELHRLPAYLCRLTARDKEVTEFDQPVRTDKGKYDFLPRKERFRRIVQLVDGREMVYFKEFGDPRGISYKTGKPTEDPKEYANEIIIFSQGCAYHPYGVPRWLSDMLGIFGTYKAQNVNYTFFDFKTIPPLVIMVSGGTLSEDAVLSLKNLFERDIKGVDNFHKGIILEATPADVGDIPGEKISPVRMEIKPLTQFIQNDAQFLRYMESVDESVAASYRIPPIHRGKSKDYNRATSMAATVAAEQQVYIPERREFDYIINQTIMSRMEINYWTFRSLGAKTTDQADIVNAVAGIKEAVSVGHLQEMVAELRNVPAGTIPPENYNITLAELMNPGFALPTFDGNGKSDKETAKALPETVRYLVALRKSLIREIEKHDNAESD
jgi:PBSX family phage portal protein